MKRFGKYVVVVFVNLVLLIVMLKVIDIFFEEEVPDFQIQQRQISLNEYPSNADFVAGPSSSVFNATQNLENKEYRLRTDQYGFIIGPSDIGRLHDDIDIIFFGGSTTECFFVDEDKRFPYLVGEILSNETGKRVTVRNAGLMGKHSMKSNFDLMTRGLQTNPKTVVLMHNINDLVQLLYVNSYFDGPDTRRITTDVVENKNRRSFLYRWAFQVKEWVMPNLYREVTQIFNSENGEGLNEDEWAGWRNESEIEYDYVKGKFKNSLLTFISIAKSNNMQVVLMTQFNRFNVDDDFIVKNYYDNVVKSINHNSFFEFYHIFNDVIREVADNENVLLVDLAKEIPPTMEYLYDAVHVNTNGSVLSAHIIADLLNRNFYQ